MQHYELLELIQQEMQKSGSDIKAEAQLLQCMDKGLLQDDFMISCDHIFRRAYRKDIISAVIDERKSQHVLQMHLSRSGLYDHLPEGLFFQEPQQKSRVVTVGDMATDYKYNKKKEEDIRLFFQPFEHDFFLQRINIEEEEKGLLQGLQSGLLTEYFNRFWDLSKAVPPVLAGKLILLLPYAYKIAGDVELTAQCLTQLLNEEVKVIQRIQQTTDADALVSSAGLGEVQVGLDMICGNTFWDGDPVMEMTIGPLLHSQVTDYLEGGSRFTLMETFNRFFIPAGIDVILSVQLPVEKMHMILSEEQSSVLGYSSVLG